MRCLGQEFSCCEVYLVVFLNEVSGPVCFRAKSGQIDGRCLAGNFPIWMLLFYKCWLSHNILFKIEETLRREIYQKQKVQTYVDCSMLFKNTFEVAALHKTSVPNRNFTKKKGKRPPARVERDKSGFIQTYMGKHNSNSPINVASVLCLI